MVLPYLFAENNNTSLLTFNITVLNNFSVVTVTTKKFDANNLQSQITIVQHHGWQQLVGEKNPWQLKAIKIIIIVDCFSMSWAT